MFVLERIRNLHNLYKDISFHETYLNDKWKQFWNVFGAHGSSTVLVYCISVSCLNEEMQNGHQFDLTIQYKFCLTSAVHDFMIT